MTTATLERRIVLDTYGDARKLRLEEFSLGAPEAGEVRVRQRAVGINYVDVYHRTGMYPLPSFPSGLGVEAAGIVEAVGEGVDDGWQGRRVAYVGPPVGAYASARNMRTEQLAWLPDDVDYETAAAILLRGLTAHMLFRYVRPLREGDSVLVQAAAGGLGLVLSQWASALGARVIGTVASPEKAALARAHGTERTVLYLEEDFVSATHDFTEGRGADFVIDGIGGETFDRSMDALAPFGMIASIGQVASDVTAIDMSRFHASRSIAISRPSVIRFISDQARYREGCQATFDRLSTGMRARIGERFSLEEATLAHEMLESGRSAGSLLLIP
jgi:NADPH2:quinone reductase